MLLSRYPIVFGSHLHECCIMEKFFLLHGQQFEFDCASELGVKLVIIFWRKLLLYLKSLCGGSSTF